MIVHHLDQSHSHVILWLLEELGIDYEIVRHARDPVTGLSPDTLAAVHPIAKAPTIEDRGVVMVESTGIILYLLETYGNGRLRPPPGTGEAMLFYQNLTFIEGSAKAPLMGLFPYLARSVDDPQRIAADARAARFIGVLDRAVADGGGTLVPGLFTAADMQLTFLEELVESLLPIARWPDLEAHLARSRAMDGYRRAEAKGGPVAIGSLFARIAQSRAGAQKAG